MREAVPKRAHRPTGFRRITPEMLPSDDLAERFEKLPGSVKSPSQILGAFKAAAPHLGISRHLVGVIDWFFAFTRPQDWEPGSRPIVWPSAEFQQTELDRSKSQIKAINRRLVELQLVTIKDSPNGKRYGRRHPQTDKIVEAYGFDLSPLAQRYDEFVAAAAAGRLRRAELSHLRRRRTIARNRIVQLLETAADNQVADRAWQDTAAALAEYHAAAAKGVTIEDIRPVLESLEQRLKLAQSLLENLLDKTKTHPMGPENRPHQYTYNPRLNPNPDTVIASKTSSARRETEATPAASQHEPDTAAPTPPPAKTPERALSIKPDELLDLAPRLRDYVTAPYPTWPDIVDGADFLRHELGVSHSLWVQACTAMGGRDTAAIALAIVSTKPKDHFLTSPAGYFFGMVAKAKAGELNLDRTIWGLRTSKNTRGSRP